jgi:glycogen debranching enzyme
MRRRTVIAGLALSPALGGAAAKASVQRRSTTSVLDSLALPVTREENRQFSYTDKASAYFHGRTHTDNNPDWFNGWNIATKRIFHDYRLSVDGRPLSRTDADVVVAPDKVTRIFAKATETLSMLDGLTVLVLALTNVTGTRIGLALTGDLTDAGTRAFEGVWFAPKEAAGTVLLVAPLRVDIACVLDATSGVSCPKAGGGFLLIHASNQDQARQTLARVRRNLARLQTARVNRMEALVSGKHALDAGDPDRTKALLWIRLTGDQLIMKQLGTGIYAGLPWFNDYWGRDTFISITGLLFTMGRYAEAAEVFTSFAALQDTNPNSKTYGRVPNRARPDGIEYNSADGTPRFIITLAELSSRSGDNALARRLWPVVKRAIDGLLKNNVDELGFVTHEDADTWMDAKEKGLRAWSPRGNRAVDVQTLWLDALFWGLHLHSTVADRGSPKGPFSFDAAWVEKVDKAESKLRLAMTKFHHPQTGHLVDHIRPDGAQDLSVRPNALFSIGYDREAGDPLVVKLEREMTQVRDLWQALVYPWGVATLSQDDPNFYPYHEHWHYYHKDAAYHNGTVWPWLNGIAIQRLIEFNQIEPAWRLFENMNRQALREGAVGSLAECADALPIEGAKWSRRTGTFLQAWSNAEQLRVWQECFLGFYTFPSNEISDITFRPRLPPSVQDVKCGFQLKAGWIEAHFNIGGAPKWRFTWHGKGWISLGLNALTDYEVTASAGLEPGGTVEFNIELGQISAKGMNSRVLVIRDDNPVDMSMLDNLEAETAVQELRANLRKRRAMEKRIFANLDFCQPRLAPNLKSLSVRHDPPLTY